MSEEQEVQREIESVLGRVKDAFDTMQTLWRRRTEGERVGPELAATADELKALGSTLTVLEQRQMRLKS